MFQVPMFEQDLNKFPILKKKQKYVILTMQQLILNFRPYNSCCHTNRSLFPIIDITYYCAVTETLSSVFVCVKGLLLHARDTQNGRSVTAELGERGLLQRPCLCQRSPTLPKSQTMSAAQLVPGPKKMRRVGIGWDNVVNVRNYR